MLRTMMLKMARNESFTDLVSFAGRKSGMVDRFVAGKTLEEAVPVVREFSSHGIRSTLDLLGEGVTRADEAREMAGRYLQALQGIDDFELGSTISLKLTQLGLEFDPDLCRENLRNILQAAVECGNFVRIDMESSSVTQLTLDVYRDLAAEFGNRHVGIVIQAYLYRSEKDVEELCRLGSNIRLCKGAYMEPESVAFVQCAGSRDQNHLPYCSGVCCMGSLKQINYVKEQYPDAQISMYYIDIRAMAEEEVEVVDPQALQSSVTGIMHVLGAQAQLHGLVPSPEHLRGNGIGVSRQAQIGQGLAHDLLRFPGFVDLGVVEEVHPGVVGGLQEGFGFTQIDLPPEGHPRAQ